MKKTIEEIMKESGWLKTERTNCGKTYVEFVKGGFIIDEEDIIDSNADKNEIGGKDGRE